MGDGMPEVGDLVRDEALGENAVVTDIKAGQPLLRSVYGGGTPWIPEDPERVKLQARRGDWRLP
ncbi:hypothetical protein [Streptomyces sp. NPDC058989]|uniref:hypothetical protein n=1 Tax=Streptomyces sp. NPDC058989 TaxID=3346686 RepID=UPI003683551D